jgi:hypothetical protein
METALPDKLTIALGSERIDEGSPEERASFGLFTIRHGGASLAATSLTEGFDFYLNGLRDGPLVPGCHVAEWFAWNWWRLRWEGRSASPDWPRAHQMASIGEGFLWPNITIFSDGVRTALISRPSSRAEAKPFRFIGAHPVVLPSTDFEAAVDAFIPQILGRLESLSGSNLARLWDDILIERADSEIAKRRRLEALLGRDAGDSDESEIDRLLADEGRFGEAALGEIAADHAQAGHRAELLITSGVLEDLARTRGYDTRPGEAVRLKSVDRPPTISDAPAWQVGVRAAQALREQEGLGGGVITDKRLGGYAAVVDRALQPEGHGAEMSFSIEEAGRHGRLVLRSRWRTGRRFELARIVGDRLMEGDEVLRPATRSHTYRQQAQRSFAAEFLAPFEAVDDFLQGEYSEEAQADAAELFDVSPMTINTLLKNHHRLPRDPFDDIHLAA